MSRKLETDPTAKTEAQERSKEEMTVTPSGVGLYKYEWDEIEKIAAGYGLTKHNLAVYLMRYSLKLYREGKIDITETREQVTKFRMPKP